MTKTSTNRALFLDLWHYFQLFDGAVLLQGHGAPAIMASISDISRGTLVMFLLPLAVTS